MIVCGIDEAGRGPVIGPMVMAGAAFDEKGESKLRSLNIKDSKLLPRQKREYLFNKILPIAICFKIISISPAVIDEHIRSGKSSLNLLEAETTAEILNELRKKNTINKAIIDLPDKNKERYLTYIKKGLADKSILLVAEHKADYNYVVVGAASILAKVVRDRYIDFLKKKAGEDFGSGYMSDEKTRAFLKKHWNDPNATFFRKEWVSWKNIKKENQQKRLFEYGD